ncbi:MAG: ATP synthase F1 subunit delta [Lachnospiraceae bacterium]|nr:ATP synthase F1 subunit delta [Lachnospiraceae bacterium]
MAKLISKTYGDALFETALEEGSEGALLSEALSLCTILKENPELSRLMNHPGLTIEEKTSLWENIFKGRMSDTLLGFLRVIIINDRYQETENILSYFIDTVKDHQGIGMATVTTPMPLSAARKQEIEEKLIATTRYTSMEMNYVIDESLIGGMIIRLGDRVVDSSIKSRLAALEKNLRNTQIAAL